MKIVVATNNRNKVLEYKEILNPLKIEVLSLEDVHINVDPIENGNSFEENATIKAKVISEYTDYPIIADDSGLTIDSLPNILGLHTSRFMPNDDYSMRKQNVIDRLDNKDLPRNAYFTCVICLYNYKKDPLYFRADIHGTIAYKDMGENGFGFDGIFIPNGSKITYAQMNESLKNSLSHRGVASQKLINYLKEDQHEHSIN